MSALLDFSLALLWGVVVLEALVFRETLAEIPRLANVQNKAQHLEHTQALQLPKGTPAPEFAANLTETDKTLRTSELKGQSTILLFLSPEKSASLAYEKLAASVHALWHRSQGHLYVICSGEKRGCRNLLRDRGVQGVGVGPIPLAFDENRSIADSFKISSTPMAVMLDEEAQVTRYGQPIIGGEGT